VNSSKEFAMKIEHAPHHWISVALVLAATLFTLSELHGQTTGSAAAFEGRPAIAGAQGGLGAQAGPAQGGIGLQGTDGAQRSVVTRRPGTTTDTSQGVSGMGGMDVAAARTEARTDVAAREDAKPARDQGVTKPGRDQSIAKDERSAVKKSKRAAKRTITRSKHGVSEIDATAAAGANAK
jgi:hypothetical protein